MAGFEVATEAFVPHANAAGTKAAALLAIERTSSLEQYKILFDNLGCGFGTFLTAKEQETISFIFSFRNLLAHGQRESYLIFSEEDFNPKKIVGSFYENIETFLVKRRILKKTRVQPDHLGLFSDSVADFVFNETIGFTTKMRDSFPRILESNRLIQKSQLNMISMLLRSI